MPEVRAHLSRTEDLGALLKTIRLNQSLTEQDIGECVGRSAKQIARYETGEYSIPSVVLIEWAVILGYDLVLSPYERADSPDQSLIQSTPEQE